MTRVSLREAYDNKDVVAQIYAIRDTAESAEDSAEQAVTTANTASDHVDALVPQVEGAVQNANSASASAQASAQTVAGYENRLATVESDLNAVTLRVTTAEGQIVTIEGRVTALETADGQNVKINRINDYAVGLTGNQDNILGEKAFANMVGYPGKLRFPPTGQQVDKYTPCFSIPNTHRSIDVELWTSGARGGRAKLHIDTQGTADNNAYYLFRKGQNSLSTLYYDDAVKITVETDQVTVWLKYRQYSEVAYWISMYVVYGKLKEGEQITFTDSSAPRLTADEIDAQYSRVITPTL